MFGGGVDAPPSSSTTWNVYAWCGPEHGTGRPAGYAGSSANVEYDIVQHEAAVGSVAVK
jgi:hypothetical protein